MELTHNNKTYKATEYWNNFVDSNIKYWILRGYLELVEETKPEEKYPLKSYKVEKDLSLTEIPTYWYIETSEMKKSEYWEIFKEWFTNKPGCNNFEFNCQKYGYDDNGYDFGPFPTSVSKLSPQQWYDTIYDGEKKCTECNGFGKEICTNPDHNFIDSISWGDTSRLGCPCCGHDEHHRMKEDCWKCKGTSKAVVDQDKAMDKGVEEKIELLEEYNGSPYAPIITKHLEALTHAVNSLIKKHNR